MAERPRNIERGKAIFGMGVGVGADLGFSLAFAMNGRYDFAGFMFLVTVGGGYAANEHLKSVCQDKKASQTATLTKYFPPEVTGQVFTTRADILRGCFSSFQEVPLPQHQIILK